MFFPAFFQKPQLFASLAASYAKMGERENALAAAEKMFSLFPALEKQRGEFLAALEDDLLKNKK